MSENHPEGPDRHVPDPQMPPVPQVPPVPPAQPPAGGFPPAPGANSPPGQPAQHGYQQSYAQPGYPPGGGYPPPPQAGYGPGPVTNEVPVVEAFSYGWTKFTQNVGVILLAALTYIAVFAVVSIIFFVILVGTAAASTDASGNISGGGVAGFGVGLIVFIAIAVVLAALVQAGIIRGALTATEGRPLVYQDFFRFTNIGTVILTALLLGLATAILSITFIGGIVFAFFAQFALFFVIDKKLGAIDSITASFRLVYANLATVVLLFIGVYVAEFVGSLLLGVGLLITMPVAMIASAYVYRGLINEHPA